MEKHGKTMEKAMPGLPKDHEITILEAMPSILVRMHRPGALHGHSTHDGTATLLAVLVVAGEAVAKVHEDRGRQPQRL